MCLEVLLFSALLGEGLGEEGDQVKLSQDAWERAKGTEHPLPQVGILRFFQAVERKGVLRVIFHPHTLEVVTLNCY